MTGTNKALALIGGPLMLFGSAGFLAPFLLALGAITPSESFQWPAGVADVAFMSDGQAVVGLVQVGRIQVYDKKWKFIRGWQVDAEGGYFKLVVRQPDIVDVYTARGENHFVYTVRGELVSGAKYSEPYSSIQADTVERLVPGRPLLVPFSNIAICWGMGAAGTALLFASSRKALINAQSAAKT
jgi:hypothetical protein